MEFNPVLPPPFITADLPGIGGVIKQRPEDFEVEEIPAYEPSGQGEFLYLWIEKRGMGAEYFAREIARRLQIPPGEVGVAGLKDRHAVTRQQVSVPVAVEERLKDLESPDLHVLKVGKHTNKLKTGHLRGNRFRIFVRDVEQTHVERTAAIFQRLQSEGVPNYYGEQRFGKNGETVQIGMALVRGGTDGSTRKVRNPFLRKLALSAVQSGIFNHYLAQRWNDGLLRKVLPGDVMGRRPFGGMFNVVDVAVEQERFDRRETVHCGPMFGRKTFPTTGAAAEREDQCLREVGIERSTFTGFGKLLMGTRRHNLVYPDGLTYAIEADGVRFSFSLPTGSYATILLREFMKTAQLPTDENIESPDE